MQKSSERLKRFYKLWLPIYKINNKQIRANYRAIMPILLDRFEITNNTTILDVGTGTGGFAGVLLDFTSNITAIDFSNDMIDEARKNYGEKINFINMDACNLNSFETESFDLVVAAYCLHDMSNEDRLDVLEQMRRIAKEKVIILELEKTKNPIVHLIEILEGSYYKDFIKHIDRQLATVFPNYEKVVYLNEMGVYICDI